MKFARLFAVLSLLVLSGCANGTTPGTVQGYVEGDYVLLAPEEAGRIAEVTVQSGDQVAAGATVFRMDTTAARAARDAAAAQVAQAEARLADLRKGQRPQELDVIRARIAEAEAGVRRAQAELDRLEPLTVADVASTEALDLARAEYDRARAQAAALHRELDVAELAARPDTIEAAQRAVASARAALDGAQYRLDRCTVVAPAAGVVDDLVRYAGETASPTAPVILFLPEGARRIRFFVPEPRLATVALGDRVAVTCDACPADLRADVSFIATEAEYTPPVIFSVQRRQKLVFMVEARPVGAAAGLRPGQPVIVQLQRGRAR